MNYKFFTNSNKTWASMYREIKDAKVSVFLEMYIFQNDMEKYNFFDLIQKKAKEGLTIKVILDSFGSKDLGDEAILALKQSGVELLFVSYLFHRMHRKVLIVDEKVAFIGGVNLHQSTQFWNDLVVLVRGRLVSKIVKSFARSYMYAHGSDPKLIAKSKKNVFTKKVNVWLVEHSPVKKIFNLKKIYKDNLNKAEKNIILITPYFMPKRWLVALLHQAVLRGVKVEIFIPKHTDHAFFLDKINHFYINKLSKLGIIFYMEAFMNHAKVMIIDNKEGIIGSNNLDILSFDLNAEVGVFFKDSSVVNKLLKIVESWKKKSYVFSYKKYKPSWFYYILSPIMHIFYRVF